MPYRKEQFVSGEIYHIVLRGIDNNLIFKDVDDYYRGIFSIYEFNTVKSITIQRRREARLRLKESRGRASTADERERLVEVLIFCLMPNHIHLLLKQIKDNSITKFMSKVGTGFGGYFNRKYKRKGHVFQNRFAAIPIKNEEQLKTLFVYVHTNPISLIEPGWKESGIKEPGKAIEFLENYKWSSYQDYIGKKNFSSVTEKDFMLKVMGGEEGCRDFIENWVRHKEEIKELPKIALE